MKRFLVGLMVATTATIGFGSVVFASTSAWTEDVYNSSGHALKGVALPASADGTASFSFAPGVFTATLTTTDESLTGDLSGKTLSDMVSVTGMSTGAFFLDQNNGGCTPDNQSVRLFFTSGGTGAGDPRGFYTTFWWSNPASLTLTHDANGTFSASLGDPSKWSDWNGKQGNSSPDVTAAFKTATTKVLSVGLSFGGGCFFENGVTTSDGSGIFNSSFSET